MQARALVTVILLLSLLPGRLPAQDSTHSHKIDPYLKRLFAAQSPTDTLHNKIDCIIHTTRPEALKKKGIKIITVTPRAVTASLSFAQLTDLAAMPEVKFIEAPEFLKMHPQKPTYPNSPKQ